MELSINYERIGLITIQRKTGTDDVDSFNEYKWRHMLNSRVLHEGTVTHRYGDGAAALASHVLGLIGAAHQKEARSK